MRTKRVAIVRDGRKAERGLSLLEVMIALTVFAAATAIVVPNLLGGLNRSGRYAAQLDFDGELRTLRQRAYETERRVVLLSPDGGQDGERTVGVEARRADDRAEYVTLTLPGDWTYRLSQPITFSPNGACSGGVVRLEKQGLRPVDLTLTEPRCRPQRN